MPTVTHGAARDRAPRFGPEQEAALFLSRWIKAPHLIGSVAPSSRGLARAMARQIDARRGTASSSSSAAAPAASPGRCWSIGLAPGRLVVVERDRTLAALLRPRFPGVKVMRGDAAELVALLAAAGDRLRRRGGVEPAAAVDAQAGCRRASSRRASPCSASTAPSCNTPMASPRPSRRPSSG